MIKPASHASCHSGPFFSIRSKSALLFFLLFFPALLRHPVDSGAQDGDTVTIIDSAGISDEALPQDWKQVLPRKQKAYTNYVIEQSSGESFMRISSGGTGSWLEKKVRRIDLTRYPIMEWTWMISSLPDVEWEQDREDDDYAIRIELVYDLKGSMFNPLNIVRKGLVRTLLRGAPPELIICYVWSHKVPAGEAFTSPVDSRTIIIPLESGSGLGSRWIAERRNILADLREYREMDFLELKKIRIRSDTDDTNSSAAGGLKSIILRASGTENAE